MEKLTPLLDVKNAAHARFLVQTQLVHEELLGGHSGE